MTTTKYFKLAGILGLGIAAQACSSDSTSTPHGVGISHSAVSKYDVEHPSWKMHPAALIVQREDIDFIYDVEVQKEKLILPTAGHEAFLQELVEGETILVGRANEENIVKNGGFVRRIEKVRTVGDKTELDTTMLKTSDIVRGTLDSAIEKPWGVKVAAGVSPQGAKLQKRIEIGEDGKIYHPFSYDKHIDVDFAKGYTHKSGESEVSFRDPKTKTVVNAKKEWLTGQVSAKAEVDVDVHVAPILEFYLNIDADVDWGWTGPSIDIDIDTMRAAVGVEYEVTGSLYMALAGSLNGKGSLDAFSSEINLFPGCNIGGIPCGVSLETKFTCEATVGGALEYKTTKPAKVYGTPRIGAEYRDGKWSTITGDLFHMEAAEASAGMNPVAAAQNVFGTDVTRVTMKAYGNANCRYEPRVSFYIGESFGWWIFDAEARAGVYAALAPVASMAVGGCVQMDFPSASWVNPKWGYGFKAELQPEAGVFAKALLSGHGLDWDKTLDLGGAIEIFKIQGGSLDPFGAITCSAP